MTTAVKTEPATLMYRVFIKATPEAIWQAITDPDWTMKYGYASRTEYELRPGGKYRGLATEEMKKFGGPEVVVDGEVIESDPPRKLVQTWRALWDPALVEEGARRLTWEIAPGPGGTCSLTLTHEVERAPRTAEMVSGNIPTAGGGWPFVLSDLKSLLETGKAMNAK